MADYAEQQAQEIEALQAIFSENELHVECADFPNIEISLTVATNQVSTSEEEEEEDGDGVYATVSIKMPKDYPDVAPEIELLDVDDYLDEEQQQALLEKLKATAESYLGMVSVFSIISTLQEEIGQLMDRQKENEQKQVEEEKRKVEVAEQKRFEGTRVTVESFNAWKTAFMQEMAASKEKAAKERAESLAGKLTGRQLFLRDASLNLSDVKFLEEEGENAEIIDEDLFGDEDLTGLEAEEDDGEGGDDDDD